jgi:hypothetical protein
MTSPAGAKYLYGIYDTLFGLDYEVYTSFKIPIPLKRSKEACCHCLVTTVIRDSFQI